MFKYKRVSYEEEDYYVCKFELDGKNTLFVIDADDIDKIKKYKHHKLKLFGRKDIDHKHIGRRLGFTRVVNEHKIRYYLVDIIMGKKEGHCIYHKTHNYFDLRKENLKFIENEKFIEICSTNYRKAILPKKCGITDDDLPRYVFYSKTKEHDEMFGIRFKVNNNKIAHYSSTSSNISLEDKYNEIMAKLFALAELYPDFLKDEDRGIFRNYSNKTFKLMKNYNKIIVESSYICAVDNIMEIPEKKVFKHPRDKNGNKIHVELNSTFNNRRHTVDQISSDFDITPQMIPKHCYYEKDRGSYFRIKNHPKLKSWKTTTAKSIKVGSVRREVTLEDKFNMLLDKIDEIEGRKTKKRYNGPTGDIC